MNRPTLCSISAVFAGAVVALSVPFAANAQTSPSNDFTVDQLRHEFIADGYRVDTPVSWWTNSHVTTFTVSDGVGQSDRVLMVLVYPDAETVQDETANADQTGDPSGRFLVPGFGPAVVRQNVALVESTGRELRQRYATELALRDPQEFGGTGSQMTMEPTVVTTAVDADFLSALDRTTANM
jgi:hypothetical protein